MDELLNKSKTNKDLLALKFKYNLETLFMYTINSNDYFYFGVEEYDFELAGYQIRRLDDLEDIDVIDNFSSQINQKEGLLEEIKDYKIDLTSYESIFNYFKNNNLMISVEHEYNNEDFFFLIGEVTKVTSDTLYFKDFDVNGVWNEEINIIPFTEITTIRFDSKYINTWSKYLK